MKYNLYLFNTDRLSIFTDLHLHSNLSLNLKNNLGISIYNTTFISSVYVSSFFHKFYLRSRILHYNLLNIELFLNTSCGYSTELLLVGLGFKVLRCRILHQLRFELHYSHMIKYNIPNDILIRCGKKKLLIFGLTRERVYDTANEIKRLRLPNAYKGKGIRYKADIIKLKPGKQR